LCNVGALIGGKPSAATLATALNGVVESITPKHLLFSLSHIL
jgi:hypothetical protein